MRGFRWRVRDERVGGGMGSRGEGRKGKVELPKAGCEVRRKKGVERDDISDQKWPLSPLFLTLVD